MRYVLTFTLLMSSLAAGAQQAPGTKEAASPQDIEPAVNTSSGTLAPATAPAVSAPAVSPPAGNAGATDKASKSATAAPAPARTGTQAKPGAKSTAHDQIQLDTTKITGNSELPNVMYVVPWKRPELGDLNGRPAKSLVDEALAPVDRDVFRRQNRYFTALQSDAAPRPTPPPPAPAGSGAPPPPGG